VGDVDNVSIVKLATDKPKVSYLSYPDFDRSPHPTLAQATYVRLRELDVDARDYRQSDNPPILHRKEKFVTDDYPNRDKFARLTAQEERYGLLGVDSRLIGTRRGWEERLQTCAVALRGHRVVRATTLET
jgi:DNA phosphorothioation-associated putative methyltransferase